MSTIPLTLVFTALVTTCVYESVRVSVRAGGGGGGGTWWWGGGWGRCWWKSSKFANFWPVLILQGDMWLKNN